VAADSQHAAAERHPGSLQDMLAAQLSQVLAQTLNPDKSAICAALKHCVPVHRAGYCS